MMKKLISGLWAIVTSAFLLGSFLLFCCPQVAFSEKPLEGATNSSEDKLGDELRYLQEETYVITPSKIPQRIEKAPGSIFVVTDKQIHQMGARYLVDVLETVPGWYSWNYYLGGPTVFARGNAGYASNNILFMVNSQTVNNPVSGSGISYWNVDLDNVKRIEFVTGPGSALYGSGAMSGVVNIITKTGDDINGLQLTGRGGSYNTWEGNALFGEKIEELEVSAYLDGVTTDGFNGHVNKDQQSLLDQRLGTHASLAPGNMRGDENRFDAQLTMKYKNFKFDGKYFGKNYDPPFGLRPILDNISNRKGRQYYLNLSYDQTITEGMNLMAKVYRNRFYVDTDLQVFPKDSRIGTPTGPVILSDNKYQEASQNSSRTGAEAQTTYEIMDSNTIVGGITFERMETFDNTIKGNYLPTSRSSVIIPLSSVQEWPSDQVLPDKKRDFWAVYIEDLWDIMEDLRLTFGGRYDHYSDFGGEFSPRVGVNWDFARNYYTKFLYSRAFRAPTFRELYHPVDGNPDLKAMTRDSYELSFGLRFVPAFSAEVTGYYSTAKDGITPAMTGSPPSLKYINLGKGRTQGFELKMKYDFGRGTYLSMNYTYEDMAIWDGYGQSVVPYYEPNHLGTLMGNIRLNRYLNLNAYLLYRGGWSRSNDDPRDDPGDYAIVNATLIARNFLTQLKNLEVRAAVKNLFNKEYISPTGPGMLPNDLPMPGINFFLELRYTF